jgi:hypothetical protein
MLASQKTELPPVMWQLNESGTVCILLEDRAQDVQWILPSLMEFYVVPICLRVFLLLGSKATCRAVDALLEYLSHPLEEGADQVGGFRMTCPLCFPAACITSRMV